MSSAAVPTLRCEARDEEDDENEDAVRVLEGPMAARVGFTPVSTPAGPAPGAEVVEDSGAVLALAALGSARAEDSPPLALPPTGVSSWLPVARLLLLRDDSRLLPAPDRLNQDWLDGGGEKVAMAGSADGDEEMGNSDDPPPPEAAPLVPRLRLPMPNREDTPDRGCAGGEPSSGAGEGPACALQGDMGRCLATRWCAIAFTLRTKTMRLPEFNSSACASAAAATSLRSRAHMSRSS